MTRFVILALLPLCAAAQTLAYLVETQCGSTYTKALINSPVPVRTLATGCVVTVCPLAKGHCRSFTPAQVQRMLKHAVGAEIGEWELHSRWYRAWHRGRSYMVAMPVMMLLTMMGL